MQSFAMLLFFIFPISKIGTLHIRLGLLFCKCKSTNFIWIPSVSLCQGLKVINEHMYCVLL